jgi:chromosome segregation ATPase
VTHILIEVFYCGTTVLWCTSVIRYVLFVCDFSHYLDFINHFVKLYNEKRSDLEEQQLHLNVGLNKIAETVEQVEEMQKSLAVKSQELQAKNDAANAKLRQMVKDQQEAEKKKVQSQEIQAELEVQTVKIAQKQQDVMADLAQVEPAVIDAQQGKLKGGYKNCIGSCVCKAAMV